MNNKKNLKWIFELKKIVLFLRIIKIVIQKWVLCSFRQWTYCMWEDLFTPPHMYGNMKFRKLTCVSMVWLPYVVELSKKSCYVLLELGRSEQWNHFNLLLFQNFFFCISLLYYNSEQPKLVWSIFFHIHPNIIYIYPTKDEAWGGNQENVFWTS